VREINTPQNIVTSIQKRKASNVKCDNDVLMVIASQRIPRMMMG